MSLLTTLPVKLAPSANDGTAVTDGGSWGWSSWTQVIASTATPICIAGLFEGTPATDAEREIQIGVGGVGSEAAVGTFRFYEKSSAGPPRALYMLPVPMEAIPSGRRVSVRTRNSTVSALSSLIVLAYYENFAGDTLNDPSCVPIGAAGASVTPDATAWTWSAWSELTSGLPDDIAVYGLSITTPVQEQIEVELGTGGAGSETPITSFRYTIMSSTEHAMGRLHLPKVYPVSASTRIAYRLRKSGTSTTAHRASLLYYNDSPIVFIPSNPCTGGGDVDVGTDPTDGVALATSRTPLVWVVFHLDAGDVAVSAVPGLNDPVSYHAGRKEPRLLSIGRPRRSVSDQFGGIQTSDLEIIVADTDRQFRTFLANDPMLNRTFDVWMADDATRRAQGLAKRLGHYAIVSYEPIGDMTFRIRGADFIGSEVSRFFAERQLIDRRFSRTVFPGLPVDLIDKVESGYYGWIGDDSLPETGSAVDFDETQGYGGTSVGSPAFTNFGWGDIGGTAPANLTLGEAAGGVFDSTITLYAMVTAVINGVESDPFPMTDGAGEDFTFTGTGKKLTLSTSAVTGATAYRWYVSDVPWGHQGGTATFRVFSETATNSHELTDGGNENVGPWPPPDTNWIGAFGSPMFVFVFARFSGGRSPEQVNAGYLKHGPWRTRPVRVGWIPVVGALEYWVVSVPPGGGMYLSKWVVPNTENYLDMTVSTPPPDEIINGHFLEQGAVPLHYVGDEDILGSTFRAFFVSLGVVKINSLHGSDLATPPTRVKLADSVYGSTIFAPGKTGWFYATKYREFYDEDNEARWYTMVYGISGDPVVEAAFDGTIPLTANICGFSEDARGDDGAGTDSPTIDVLAKQLLHFLDNFGNPEDGKVWKSGAWKTSHVRNGVPVHRGTSFVDAADYADTLLTGGFIGAWGFAVDGSPFSLDSWLRAAAINHDARWVINEHGQLCLLMVDPSAASVASFSDGSVLGVTAANIPDHALVSMVPQTDTLINEVRYVYKKNYVPFETRPTPAADALLPRELADTRDWYSGVIVEKDTPSMVAHGGGSILLRKSLDVQFSMHRESSAPAVIVQRFLARWAWPLQRMRFPASLLACDVRPGEVVEWEHHTLPQGSPGGGPRRLWLTSWELEADIVPGRLSSLDAWLEGDDITDLSGSP